MRAQARGPHGEDYGTAALTVKVAPVRSLAAVAPLRMAAGEWAPVTAIATATAGHTPLSFSQVGHGPTQRTRHNAQPAVSYV
jgi:hypothetical protein